MELVPPDESRENEFYVSTRWLQELQVGAKHDSECVWEDVCGWDKHSEWVGWKKQMAVPSVGGPRLIGWRSGQTRTTDVPELRENPSCRLLRGGPDLLLPEDLETNISSSWVSGLLPHLRISGLVSLRGTMSQFLVIDISPLSTCLSTHPPIHLSVLSLSLHICLLTHSPSYLAIYPAIIICSAANLPRDLYTFPSIHSPVYHLSI